MAIDNSSSEHPSSSDSEPESGTGNTNLSSTPSDKASSRVSVQSLPPIVESDLSSEERQTLTSDLDVQTTREQTRSMLAQRLIWVLMITVIATQVMSCVVIVLSVQQNKDLEDQFTYSKDIASVLLSTQTGLVGAVLGFYFGSKDS